MPRRLCQGAQRRRAPAAVRAASRRLRARPSTSTGPAPAPSVAQAVADRVGGDAPWPRARAASSVVAEREPRGERRGVRAARAVRGAVGVALARELDDALAVEEHVGRLARGARR